MCNHALQTVGNSVLAPTCSDYGKSYENVITIYHPKLPVHPYRVASQEQLLLHPSQFVEAVLVAASVDRPYSFAN